MKLFPEATDKNRQQKILSSPIFKDSLSELDNKRKSFLNTPIKTIPFNKYMLYFRTGNRNIYEAEYFDRRKRLAVFSASYLLYEREEDLEALEDTIWAICDEFTWVLPAHITELPDGFDTEYIDLFSAETGFSLSEIYYLLKDKLNVKISKRILECLEKNIFSIYLNKSMPWEIAEMNWAAVCSSGVGAAFIYASPERFPIVKERILSSMKCFIKGYGTDGICVEGISYWEYGFGYFSYFAQLLYEFSDGTDNMFDSPIVKKSADFQNNAVLRKNYIISFSDGAKSASFSPGLTWKLHKIYPDVKLMPSKYYSLEQNDIACRVQRFLRDIFWSETENIDYIPPQKEEKYFSDAEWYINKTSKLSFAAKCGNNDEPHNHNDVGSFILTDDNGSIFCDYGAGEYVKDYFSDKRYTFLCNSSFGHSVPIINSVGQCEGKEYCGKVIKAENDIFEVDLAKAYSNNRVTSIIRNISLKDNIFKLRDEYKLQEQVDITERFVTMLEPKYNGEKLTIGKYDISFNPELKPIISSHKIAGHSGEEDILYSIDFKLENTNTFVLECKKIR